MRYVDPEGRIILNADSELKMSSSSSNLGNSEEKICNVGCVLTAYTRIASAIIGGGVTLEEANDYATGNSLFAVGNLLTPEAGTALINGLLKAKGITDTEVEFSGSYLSDNESNLIGAISITELFPNEYFVTARIETTNKAGSEKYGHHVNINHGSVFADTENGICNLSINDTSGVRKQLYHDSRSNKLLRFDLFKVIKIHPTGEEQ